VQYEEKVEVDRNLSTEDVMTGNLMTKKIR
jgi:hypothetical protein